MRSHPQIDPIAWADGLTAGFYSFRQAALPGVRNGSFLLVGFGPINGRWHPVPHALMDALIAHADLEIPVGKGCVALSLSRRRLDDRELREKLGADLNRLGGLSLVFRRFATRFDRLASHCLAFIHIGASMLWMRCVDSSQPS